MAVDCRDKVKGNIPKSIGISTQQSRQWVDLCVLEGNGQHN